MPSWAIKRILVNKTMIADKADDQTFLDEELKEGWEPFAVTDSMREYCYHLRRAMRPSYYTSPLRNFAEHRQEADDDIEQRLNKLEEDLKILLKKTDPDR